MVKKGILAMLIGTVNSISMAMHPFMIETWDALPQAPFLEFDRKTIINTEGYWASSANPKEDRYHSVYPFPKANKKPWPGQEEFLKKLEAIEKLALHEFDFKPKCIYLRCMNGCALSRLEPEVVLGNTEFWYIKKDPSLVLGADRNSIRWTDAMRKYYIPNFNVKPSQEFYEFVMSFELPASQEI